MNRTHRQAETTRSQSATRGPSPELQAMFASARVHHQAGRLGEAEQLYRSVLEADAGHADSLHLLGLLASQTGRLDLAVDLISRAVAIDATVAAYHANLGVMLRKQGRPNEAIACYQRALELKPDDPGVHRNLGNLLREQGRLEAAEASYRRALKLRPDDPEAHNSLGIVHRAQGRLEEAVACYRRAIELRPDYPEAHNNLGVALTARGQPEEAVSSYRRALELRPANPEAHNNLGVALAALGQLDEAVSCYRAALDLRPDYADAHYNLGNALSALERVDEADVCFRRAIGLRPDHPETHVNLGNALVRQGRLDEADVCYRGALALRPDYPDAHCNLATVLLARGELAAGWEEFEWRWQTPQLSSAHRDFSQPQWRGEAASGRTLLIHDEQGFGDTLQFCRYGPLAAARGPRVIMEVPKPLVRLLQSLPGVDLVLARGEQLPEFDLHCPMLSLPLALGTTITTIPGATPYLRADEVQLAAWRTRLAEMANRGPRIGLVWAGSSRSHSPALAAVDRRRSVAPARLAPLFDVPGLQFFSLQKDGPAAPEGFPVIDFMAEMGDFADTAALIANLDLVISVDTAVAHLAGALGKPVWLLDRFDACWRWLTGRRDSPWYPGLRLYRQPSPGDWDAVLAEVVRDLRGLAV